MAEKNDKKVVVFCYVTGHGLINQDTGMAEVWDISKK